MMRASDNPQGGMSRKTQQKKPTSSRPSVNALKKRRRDLKRSLEHSEKLPADVRIGYERELASCNHELETAESDFRRSQMIKKYHMVRFFERKKATRALKKAKQSLAEAESPAERVKLEAEVHNCKVDLDYTQYYPLDVAYVSLYAGKKDQGESVNRADSMWKIVEREMGRGRLQTLRDGKLRLEDADENALTVSDRPHTSKKTSARIADVAEYGKNPKKSKQQREAASRIDQDDADKEDGAAFFES